MSSGEAILRTQAMQYALELVDLFDGSFRAFEVCGSLRREKLYCHDIEIVFLPRTYQDQADLFGGSGDLRSEVRRRADELMARGILTPKLDINNSPRWGERLQWATYKGVTVDLEAALPPAQFGLKVAIRTGPKDFSRLLVTSRLEGGLMPPGMRVQHGGIYEAGINLIETPTELDVFRVLGIPYLEPPEREAKYGTCRPDGGAL
jgi:DNA polymerase/3'-5' exonuclease PolX